jgi:hypothetical protein
MIENPSGRANALLNDDFFNDVVEKQRSLYLSNILNSREDDVEFRERSLLKLRALEEFIASLQSIAKNNEIKEKRFKIF